MSNSIRRHVDVDRLDRSMHSRGLSNYGRVCYDQTAATQIPLVLDCRLSAIGHPVRGATLLQLRATLQEATREKDALEEKIRGLEDKMSSLQNVPKSLGDIEAILKRPHEPRNAFTADLGLKFVYPKSVDLALLNLSGIEIVRDPKYQVVLWNLDTPAGREIRQPLPIPVSTARDFIRPRDYLGPLQIMGQPGVRSLVKNGDRIFGCAMALCSNCRSTRYYWLYFVDGQGGWYAEGKRPNLQTIAKHLPNISQNPEQFLLQVAPLKKRLRIED
jgi:hypothetical protein